MSASKGLVVYKDAAVEKLDQRKKKQQQQQNSTRKDLQQQQQRRQSQETAEEGICSTPRSLRKPLSVVHEPSSNDVVPKTSGIAKKSPSSPAPKTSLCADCRRAISSSSSNGAVCFIGNNGRVSACSVRSAITLCKNLHCAANNPAYVAAMSTAVAPKKYLVSKRHELPSYGLVNAKRRQSPSPSPSPSPSLQHQGHHRPAGTAEKQGPNGSQPRQSKRVSAAHSPFLASPSWNDRNKRMSVSMASCSSGSTESWSKEEDSLSSDLEFLHLADGGRSSMASWECGEGLDDVTSRLYNHAAYPGTDSSSELEKECLKDDLVEPSSDVETDETEGVDGEWGGAHHEVEDAPYGIEDISEEIKDVRDELMVNDNPFQASVVDGDVGLWNKHDECVTDGNIRDCEDFSDDFVQNNVSFPEKVTLDHGGMLQSLVKVNSNRNNDITMISGGKIVQSNVELTMVSGDAMVPSHAELNNGSEDSNAITSQQMTGNLHDHEEEESSDCADSNAYADDRNENDSIRLQRIKGRSRSRVSEVVEDMNPESVTLRKQKALERKAAEEWMLNHAIEGAVCKLAPSGKPKVKILVKAFESVIAHKDPLEAMT